MKKWWMKGLAVALCAGMLAPAAAVSVPGMGMTVYAEKQEEQKPADGGNTTEDKITNEKLLSAVNLLKAQKISLQPNEKQAQKLVQREAERLRMSFEAAKSAGFKKYIMFLHYPPTNIMEIESVFTQMAEEYGAEHVVYSHCHGKLRYADSIRGMHHGICYHLVSGDYLNFTPEKIVD